MLKHESPYAAAPLYACESAHDVPQMFYRAHHGVTLPAPLPGYALVAFVPFAVLPPIASASLWLAVLIASFGVAIVSLRALGIAPAASIPVLALGFGLTALPFGELVPLALAGCCASAAALRRGAHTAAVAWASLAAIEPHVGAALIVALLAYAPTRSRTLVAVAGLGLIDVAATGGASLGYVSHVLPQHALAELARSSQYSLSWILNALGVPAREALAAGAVSYGTALALGVYVARNAARAGYGPHWCALAPAAFVLLGGTFVHLAQMILALPAALLAVRSRRTDVRMLAGSAMLLIAVPWNVIAQTPVFVPLVALATFGVTRVALAQSPTVSLRIALASTAACGVLAILRAHAVPAPAPAPPLDPRLAQYAWGAWIAAHDRIYGPAIWLAKAPTWIGLGALAAACVRTYEQGESPIGFHDAPAGRTP